jgi:hypothetical protein
MNPESSLQRMPNTGQALQPKTVNQENRKMRSVYFGFRIFPAFLLS